MSDETRSIEEAIAGVLHRHDAVSGAWWTEDQVASLEDALVEAIEAATPAAGEDDLADLRTRLAEYVEDWDTQPMHAAWSSRVAIGPREARALLALLRTPSGEGPVVHIPDDAE